jgi:2-oxoglutarate dehydrogenase complex dehydrogenase (E1) component-like enzyme
MVRSFRNRGHFAASLDPLAVTSRSSLFSYTDNISTPIYSTNAPTRTISKDQEVIQIIDKKTYDRGNGIKGEINHSSISSWLPENLDDHPDVVRMLRNYPIVDLSIFGLENVDKTVRYDIGDELSRKSVEGSTAWTVPEIVEALIQTYCGNVGAEYLHIETESQRDWLKNKIEGEYGPSQWYLHIYVHLYIYIYIYIHTYIYVFNIYIYVYVILYVLGLNNVLRNKLISTKPS